MKDQKKLANHRKINSIELTINSNQVYLTTSTDQAGKIVEIFIRINKLGSDLQTLLDCFCISTSFALQAGVPLERLIKHFKGVNFAPRGLVEGHENINFADSIIDLVFQELEYRNIENNKKTG